MLKDHAAVQTISEFYLSFCDKNAERKAFIACSAALYLTDEIASKIIEIAAGVASTPHQLLLSIKSLGCTHEQWDGSWYIAEGVRLALTSHLDELPAQTHDRLRQFLAKEADRRCEMADGSTELGRCNARAASLEAAFQRGFWDYEQAGRDFFAVWKAAQGDERQVIAATVEIMASELEQRLPSRSLPCEVVFLQGMAAQAKSEYGRARACFGSLQRSGRKDLSEFIPQGFEVVPAPLAANILDPRERAEEDRVVKKVRVLQLHNLNVGPVLENNPFTLLHRLLEQELANKVDYLVVCGNFTCDRSAESFQHAKKLLRNLARELLPRSGPLANRVVFVPGPQDVPDPDADHPDLRMFQQFYEDFFRDEFGVERKFDPESAELRELKDLTLIGLTYWKSAEPEVSRNRVRAFGDALDRAIRSMSSLSYVNTAPVLLISAETPLLSDGEQWSAANASARNAFNADLRISFHLFGGGPLTYLPPAHPSHEHISLGLGSEAESGSLWPLRMNLLELGGERSSGERPTTADWTAFGQHANGETWEKRTSLSVFETKNMPSLEPQFEELYFDFQERLSFSMFQPEIQMIHAQGFPGSGISDVFARITNEKSRKMGGRQVCVHGHRWEGEDGFGKFLRRLGSSIVTAADCAVHLIVMYDPSFQRIGPERQKARIDKILDACQAFFFQAVPCKLLYLTDFALISLKLEGYVVLPFGALSESAIENFLAYNCRVPLQRSQISGLTGGYVDLSQRLLRGCEFVFSSWPGAQDIDNCTSSALLGSSLGYSEVRDTCQRFFDCVKSMGGGAEVFDYVRKRVLDHYNKHTAGNSAFCRVEVDFDGLRSPHVLMVRDLLSSYQVFKRIGTSNRYEVRVAAPFLGQRCATVLFFYHLADNGLAEQVRALLEEKGREERSEVKALMYSADDWNSEGGSIKAGNLCVLLPQGFDFGEWGGSEVKAWEMAWPSARRIILVPDSHSPLPQDLRKSYVIPAIIPVRNRRLKGRGAETLWRCS